MRPPDRSGFCLHGAQVVVNRLPSTTLAFAPASPKPAKASLRIWLGGLAFGNHYGALDRTKAIQTIRFALDAGITWFDTSPAYGDGLAEEILGEASRDAGDTVCVSTKIWNPDQLNPRESIVRSLGQSLARLKRNHVDLCYLQCDGHRSDIPALIETMTLLRSSGVIRAIGLCTASPPVLNSAIGQARVDAVQAPYNILERSVERSMLPLCEISQASFHACEPFCSGLLLGHLHKNSVFERGDLRIEDRRFRGERFRRTVEIVNRLQVFASQERLTMLQLALGWVLQHPLVSTAICGARSPQQIRETVAASATRLTPEQILELDLIVGEDSLRPDR